jgi:beta-1,4-mannosyl-glycoprotein beta-1,4-N-acetylglucosaminyltransferase
MIYDCFTFFNELDLLEIRLNILDKVADRFVLVEATRTHQNKIKPLYYEENKKRFEKFHDKIIHIVVDNYPTFFSKLRMPNAWDLEKRQRDQIKKGLIQCKADDWVIVSDLDEIPDPEKIILAKEGEGITVFKQKNFYYFLNCLSLDIAEQWWCGSVMARRSDFNSPQDLRAVSKRMHAENMRILKDKNFRNWKALFNPVYKKNISIIDKGGWHFGFLGGVDKIIEKLEAFAHTEYNKVEYKNREAIVDAINTGKDLFGRGFEYQFVPVDESYPTYLLQNKIRYSHLISDSLLEKK